MRVACISVMIDCLVCQKGVSDEQGLRQHFQAKHLRCYCTRCQRCFSSLHAKKQHVAASPEHHVCNQCAHKPDFLSVVELDEHVDAKHCFCITCALTLNNLGELIAHNVAIHNTCNVCHRPFDTPSNLFNVCYNRCHFSRWIS